MYETLGDDKARALVSRCIALMTDSIHRYGGTLIKTIGDEVMATFPSADEAADAASEMQGLVSGLVVDEYALAIRIGFHYGPALQEERDVFGDAVNLAARITDQAKAGQILTTSLTVEALTRSAEHQVRHVDRTTVKGKKEMIGVCELLWQYEGITRSVTSQRRMSGADSQKRMLLRYHGGEIEMGEAYPMVAIGRVASNDLVVDHDLVSRLHARIEHRKGKFTLSDLSTNGTFVAVDGGAPQFVRRDSLILKACGLIGLGRAPTPGSPETIRYELLD
ncbi:MAG: adenylate/guanylate cyclase domain-containing protein, partial [Nevskiales bacterium]